MTTKCAGPLLLAAFCFDTKALFLKTDQSAFDHLSRYGEWDTSDDPEPQVLT